MHTIQGVNALLLTPFTETGQVDDKSLRRHIDHAIDGGVAGLVSMDRIGEVEHMTLDEQRRTMKVVVDHTAGRVPVGFGIVGSSFEDGLTIGQYARETGGDYVMSRPPVDGEIFEYYQRLAEIIPVMIDNAPAGGGGGGGGAAAASEEVEGVLVGELSIQDQILPLTHESRNIIALKLNNIPDKVEEAKKLLDVSVLTTWDMVSLLAYRMGSDGVMSVYAALNPGVYVELYRLVREDLWDEARELFDSKVLPLMNYCTYEVGYEFDPNAFSACKHVLHQQGVFETTAVRAPGPEMLEQRLRAVLEASRRAGVEEASAAGE